MLKAQYIICKNRFNIVSNVWQRKENMVRLNTNDNKTMTYAEVTC